MFNIAEQVNVQEQLDTDLVEKALAKAEKTRNILVKVNTLLHEILFHKISLYTCMLPN